MDSDARSDDPELASYYQVLAEAAVQGNRWATEPSEHEVAELLRRRGTLPTPAAIAAWYETEHRQSALTSDR